MAKIVLKHTHTKQEKVSKLVFYTQSTSVVISGWKKKYIKNKKKQKIL